MSWLSLDWVRIELKFDWNVDEGLLTGFRVCDSLIESLMKACLLRENVLVGWIVSEVLMSFGKCL